MTQLLIVDDEPQFRNTLLKALKSQGFKAMGIADADLLTSTLAVQRPDVILLDLTFDSGASGLEACEKLRTWSSVPVLIISARHDEAMKVQALNAGADDYLVKPFGIQELIARIQAVQRRLAPRKKDESQVIIMRDLTIDLPAQVVTLNNHPIDLTKKEYALLKILALAAGQLVTYETLMVSIWKDDHMDERASIRTLVKRLRQKLGDDLANPRYILTVASRGYRLNIDFDEGQTLA